MRLQEPYPLLDDMMRLIGEAGRRLMEMGACEGAAGNISVFIGWEAYVDRWFPKSRQIDLPVHVPELANCTFLVTGSGRRLGEIHLEPEANLCAVRIEPGGTTAELMTSPRALFERPTSEFNSHLAVHRALIPRDNLNFHAVIHAQPLHITLLSQTPGYLDTQSLNEKILRWQPETIVNLPKGVAYLPFELPGSDELMRATVEAMEADYRVVLWAKHGVMARSDQSVKRAVDRIEYAETGARYEHLNRSTGGEGIGLTREEIHRIAAKFGIQQDIF